MRIKIKFPLENFKAALGCSRSGFFNARNRDPNVCHSKQGFIEMNLIFYTALALTT